MPSAHPRQAYVILALMSTQILDRCCPMNGWVPMRSVQAPLAHCHQPIQLTAFEAGPMHGGRSLTTSLQRHSLDHYSFDPKIA
jgi:hypothetical protein